MDPSESEKQGANSPADWLAILRSHPEWSDRQREAAHETLVVHNTPEAIRAALAPRLAHLGDADGEVVLRLMESHGTPPLMDDLARHLLGQPELRPERLWDALNVLAGADNLLDRYPDLAERLEELQDLLDDSEAPIRELAELLEDPESIPTALEGLSQIEPEVRAEIIAGLAQRDPHTGLTTFFRLLSEDPEPSTREAAQAALVKMEGSGSTLALIEPASAAVPDRTNAQLTLAGSLVTQLDPDGRATIALHVDEPDNRLVAVFTCEILAGILGVEGSPVPPGFDFEDAFADLRRNPCLPNAHDLALRLLAGAWYLVQDQTPPAWRYWLSRACGPDFQPRALKVTAPELALGPGTSASLTTDADRVIDAFPVWLDQTDLAFDLAEELLLRPTHDRPDHDPAQDQAASRFLCVEHLLPRLDRDRLTLLWMAQYWRASRDEPLAAAAERLAASLADSAHLVPGHPVLATLATRSIKAAQNELRKGRHPRGP